MRDEKLMRFVGITSHTDPTVLRIALERHQFDCTQMALNGALTCTLRRPGLTEIRISKVRLTTTIKDQRETWSEPASRLRSASNQSTSGDP
jgi:hypothetical protein